MKLTTKQLKALDSAFTWHAMASRKLFSERDDKGVTWQNCYKYRDEVLREAGLNELVTLLNNTR